MTIKIVKVPGGVTKLDMEVDNVTVSDLKELLGLDNNQEVRVNSEKVDDDYEVEDGDTVSAAAKIKGA